MIGIYNDSFLDHLKNTYGHDRVSIKSKNIVVPCPWCEPHAIIPRYHLWISKEAPIFKCFHAGCAKGTVSKLLKKLDGVDNSKNFFDVSKITYTNKSEAQLQTLNSEKRSYREFIIPPVIDGQFPLKELYLKSRFGFSMDFRNISNLVLDIKKFITINKIQLNEKEEKLLDYLHKNFVAFCTSNNSYLIFRNIDRNSSFRHFKIVLQKTTFLDYYKIHGYNPTSNTVVLSEGIFDIFSERLFNYTNIRNDIRLFASCQSGFFDSLIKSLSFYEMMFKFDVHILADQDVKLYYFKKLKKECKHLISSLHVHYNLNAKDFNEGNVKIESFII